MVGLSHVADVKGYVGKVGSDTMRVVESIVKPYAVDVVSSAAFGGRVMESAGVDRRMEDLDMLETLTVADLTTHRADLVTAIKESARVEFRAQESESDDLKAANARADKAEADAKAAKIDAHKLRVSEAVTTAVAGVKDIPETARPLIVSRVTDRLGVAEISADKLSSTVSEAVQAETAFGLTFAPAKTTPTVPPNKGKDGEGSGKAGLQERFDRSLGLHTPKAEV
jgi:hypothetical protein